MTLGSNWAAHTIVTVSNITFSFKMRKGAINSLPDCVAHFFFRFLAFFFSNPYLSLESTESGKTSCVLS